MNLICLGNNFSGNVSIQDSSLLLYDYLVSIAMNQYETRAKIIDSVIDNNIYDYLDEIESNYKCLLNLNFEKTSLKPKITKRMDFGKFKVENIIFQSHPDHYITGNLYLPADIDYPVPAILIVCGHSQEGKSFSTYQKVAKLFALNGFASFLIDTYGQGEMYQMRDSHGNIAHLDENFGTVTHTQLDIGSMLVGSDVVSYQVWNNIRAIDYLCSRPEIDSDKIGMTGNSGGGTQTMFLAGIDDRIKTAAISCGLQSRFRMFSLNGPADGCHHLAYEGLKGIDYSDYINICLPKPIIVLAGETDPLFDIEAVSKTVRESKWFYKNAGILDRIKLFTVNQGHGYHKGLREAACLWFKKWFGQNDTPLVVDNTRNIDVSELLVTKTGQVLTEFVSSNSIVDINIKKGEILEKKRQKIWDTKSVDSCLEIVKKLIGYETSSLKNISTIYECATQDYTLKKIELKGDDDFPIPCLLFVSSKFKNSSSALIYVDSKGKNSIFEDNNLEEYLKKYEIIFAMDLRGFGETEDDPGNLRANWRKWNKDHRIAQTALHVGKPLVGQRTQDILLGLNYLLRLPEIDSYTIDLIGLNNASIPALHAAAIDDNISHLNYENSIKSWFDIIEDPLAKNNLSNVVPKALEFYDLSDLFDIIKMRN